MNQRLDAVIENPAFLEAERKTMQVFRADPEEYREVYADRGYVHIAGAISPAFLEHVRRCAADKQAQRQAMKEWEFKNKKQQYLFDFPEESDFPEGVYAFVAAVTGLPLETLTLCERHIKVYEDVAESNPPPHKDRLASEVAVGIPLEVREGSDVILYPDDELTINPFSSTALWRSSLDESELPENRLRELEPVRLHVKAGDAILFRGNSIYHERVNPAHSSLLYLKFNSLRLDPIGEDPRTFAQAEISRRLLDSGPELDLLNCRVELSPRLEGVRRIYTRLYWKEVIQGNLWGEKEFNLSEEELRLLMRIESGDRVRRVLDKLGVPVREHASRIPMLRRLGTLGAIDFRE